jgi:serine/threonine protein kinase
MGVRVSTSKAPVHDPKNFHANYILEEKIGSGTYGLVFQARHRSDTVYQAPALAVKIVPKDLQRGKSPAEVQKRFEAEVDLLRNCKGKNVVELIQIFQNRHFCYAVMELGHCTVLEALVELNTTKESHIARIFAEMTEGVAQCHKAKVVHRDIKPQNFLVTQGTSIADEQCVIKLCDLGIAMKMPMGFDCLTDVCGTCPFMAPEMLQHQGYSYNVDVWSLGVSAYLMLFGAFPYDPQTKDGHDMRFMIQWGQVPISFKADSNQPSEEAVAFLRKLLDRDPCSRPSSASVLLMPYIQHHREFCRQSRQGSKESRKGSKISVQSRCDGFFSNKIRTQNLARLFEHLEGKDKANLKNMQAHKKYEQELQKFGKRRTL